MRNECNIIRDLLPLYAENMVSADTVDFVETHLADCAACRAELEALRQPCPEPPRVDEAANESFRAFMRRWGRRLDWLQRIICILAGTLAAAAVFSVLDNGFLDLSYLARVAYGTLTGCSIAALYAWHTKSSHTQRIKYFLLILIVIVFIIVLLAVSYTPSAIEIVNR